MNAAVNDGIEESSAPEGPGRRLRTLREAQELDIARVATLLHLSVSKLEALEADDYEHLPGPVFTQGYIRNYARLLGVPAEPLLKAYRQLGGDQERPPTLKVTQVQHEVRSSHFLVRLVTWIIVLGLIALVVVWWRGYLQWPTGTSQPATETSSAQPLEETGGEPPTPADTGPELAVPEMEPGGEAMLSLPPPREEAETPAPETVPATGTPSAPEEAPGSDRVTEEGPAESPPAAVATEPPPAPKGRVVLRFNGTSWTQIRDAAGRSLVIGEMKAGSERVLQGDGPYEMVLGNAGVVEVTVDGEPFDITPYIRGNVARLTLDPAR